MAEDSSRDSDETPPRSLDRLLRRIDAHRSLPAAGTSVPVLGPPSAVTDEGQQAREPVADVVVTPARIYVTIELPGASRETIEVTTTHTQLTVHALGVGGRVFHTDVQLGHPVEPEAVTATCRNGVLDVTLPRRRGHRVRIKRGE
ncbi:MAG: Hsp20/alpha crystallin family protein [Thermoplasmata archaeon]|nr:Hsp20/alpha crystallin family protein [Thermoplasmata archaeon]